MSLCWSILLVAVLVFLVLIHFHSALFSIFSLQWMNGKLYSAAVHYFRCSLTFSISPSFALVLLYFLFFPSHIHKLVLSVSQVLIAAIHWSQRMFLFRRWASSDISSCLFSFAFSLLFFFNSVCSVFYISLFQQPQWSLNWLKVCRELNYKKVAILKKAHCCCETSKFGSV